MSLRERRYAGSGVGIVGQLQLNPKKIGLPFANFLKPHIGRPLDDLPMNKIRGLEPVMRIRPNWMRDVLAIAQRGVGCLLTNQQPHRTTRALLARAPPPVTRLEELALYGLLLETAVGGFGCTPESARHAVRRALRQLLPRTLREEREESAKIERAAQSIIDEYAAPLDTPALARRESLHAATFRRLFLVRFGVSPRDFQTQIRICRAIHLFAEETSDILAVARSVGYQQLSAHTHGAPECLDAFVRCR